MKAEREFEQVDDRIISALIIFSGVASVAYYGLTHNNFQQGLAVFVTILNSLFGRHMIAAARSWKKQSLRWFAGYSCGYAVWHLFRFDGSFPKTLRLLDDVAFAFAVCLVAYGWPKRKQSVGAVSFS
jgi:hypothetical protein